MPNAATAPRKRRTRKASTPVKQPRKSASKVTHTPVQSEPVVVTNEPKVAPPAPKLTFADYREDFQARVKVHNYEVKLLIEDVQKGYNFVLPFGKKAINFVSNLTVAE